MKLERTNKIINDLSRYIVRLFSIFSIFTNTLITIFILAGSFCSIILLYKLDPEIFLNVYNIFYPVFNFLIYFLITMGVIIFVVTIVTIFFYLVKFFITSDIRNKERKEKMIKEVVKRLNSRRKH